jgi:hypothetical protein
MRLGGPQIQYGRCEKEKNLLPLPGIEPRVIDCAVRSIVTILTELCHWSSLISLVC